MNEGVKTKLDARFALLEDERTRAWAAIQGTPPKRLYHYTDAAGLHGILYSNRLWATNISYLNDSSELAYGSALVEDALERHKQGASSRSVVEFLERSARTFNAFDSFLDVYVACFCEHGDLLSQWRGYGATGGGYAVGIESRMIGMRTPLAPQPNFVLRRVLYDREEQGRLIDSLLTQTSGFLLGLAQEDGEEAAWSAIPSFCQFLRAQVAEYLFCFKHSTFREEAEWRVVTVARVDDVPQLKFRASRQGVVPYVELDISGSVGPNAGKIPIAEIVCGPTAHPLLAKKALELYLRNRKYYFVDIVASEVPLRA